MSIPDGVIERFAAEDKSVEEEFENHPCSSFMKEYNYLFLQRDWIMTYKITDVVFLNRIGPLSIAP